MKLQLLLGLGWFFGFIFNGFAHGENQPGPSGGHIRMPGEFHTEVLPDATDGSFHIRLLDLNFQNATQKDSQVEAWILPSIGAGKSKKKPERFSLWCVTMGDDHFHCKSTDATRRPVPSKGRLYVQATRLGKKGSVAEYPLPLPRFPSAQPTAPVVDHSGH